MPDASVKDIFFDALELPAGEREAFITEACGGDAAMLDEVRRLLASHEQAGEFLGEPSIDTGTKSVAAQEEPLPDSIGGRKVLKKLGEGGFGVVYLAQQEAPVKMLVAVKVVRPGMGSSQVLARFETERMALELMNHPCIAGVMDSGVTEDGRPYFVLEHVEGETLTGYVARKNPPLRTRLELFEQVCFAVGHAHQKGVIHRDLKPSNVLVTEIDGKPTPKVIDFGIAKAVRGPLSDRTMITQSAQIVGTPQYMSPEQVSFGEVEVDTRSDVYSLGALLYEVLTGTPPFETQRINKAGAAELERIIREENPPKPSTRVVRAANRTDTSGRLARDLKGDLDWIVAKAMEKDPARRYQTPAALGADLRRFLVGDAVEAGPPSGVYRVRKFIGRHRVEFAAVTAVMLALVAVVIVSLVFATRAERSRGNAERELAKFQAISAFTEEMLSGIDPAVARGADTTLFRSILDDAAERMDAGGVDEAQTEIELRTIIGRAYESIAEFEQARAQLAVASTLGAATLGEDDPLTLDVDSSYASVLGRMSELEESLNLFTSVYQRRLARFGPDDEQTLETLSNIGAVQNQLARYQDSYETQTEVLQRRIRVLGDEHPDTMATRNNLATVLGDLNRTPEAIALLERVLEHQTSVDGEDHPRTLATMNNLAFAYDEVGRWREAESIYRRVLAIKQRVLPEGHPSTIITMNNLAGLLGTNGDPERAVEIFDEAITLCADGFGDLDIKTLTLRNNLSTNLLRLGRYDEAARTLRQVADGFMETAGPANPRTIAARAQLAMALSKVGQHAEALAIAEETSPLADANLPPNHRIVGSARLALGIALTGVGRTEEAESTLLEARQIGLVLHSPTDPRMREYLEPLLELAESSGDSASVERWSGDLAALGSPGD